MAVFRIRKRSKGGFTITGTLGDNSNLVAREVRYVADLDEASTAIASIAEDFDSIRKRAQGSSGTGK